jgi:hypothetical protein
MKDVEDNVEDEEDVEDDVEDVEDNVEDGEDGEEVNVEDDEAENGGHSFLLSQGRSHKYTPTKNKNLKGLSHEIDLAFEDMHGHRSVPGLNRGRGVLNPVSLLFIGQ